MASLMQVGLGNALAATALALVAALVCLVLRGRRPAVAHAVWLLVLLKLLTPPLRTVSIRWPAPSTPASSIMAPLQAHPATDGIATGLTATGPAQVAVEPEPLEVLAALQARPAPVVARDSFSPPPVMRHWLPVVLGLIWLAGSVGCLVLVAVRCWRFRQLMRHATPAPVEIRRRAGELSRALGTGDARGPNVWFVPGAVCPMLWAPLARPARLLLPAGLWDNLAEAQRDTLIAHELAHLRRRDHWVRLIEVAATILYWWLPVVWWARRRLREAEEQCCDAWVVWSMPRCTRHYMTAILQAVEFVSEGFVAARAAVAVPPMACGMAAGDFRQLKRRLTMIRENEADRRHAAGRTLGRTGLAALCAGAATLLPLAPSLGQVETATAPATVELTPAQTTPAPETTPRPVKIGTRVQLRLEGETAPSAENTPVPTTVAGPEGVVTQIRPFGEVVVRPRIDDTPNVTTIRSAQGAEFRLDPAPASTVDEARAEVDRLADQLEKAKARLAQLEQGGPASRAPAAVNGYRLTRSATPHAVRLAPPMAEPSQGDSNRRLDELERKLDRLLGEVERLKENRRGASQGNGGPATSSAPLTEITP